MLASFHASMCLEHLLKGYRVRQASARDLPCYSVLGDALIRQIIERKPADAQVRQSARSPRVAIA